MIFNSSNALRNFKDSFFSAQTISPCQVEFSRYCTGTAHVQQMCPFFQVCFYSFRPASISPILPSGSLFIETFLFRQLYQIYSFLTSFVYAIFHIFLCLLKEFYRITGVLSHYTKCEWDSTLHFQRVIHELQKL